jgi:hypothetical protein
MQTIGAGVLSGLISTGLCLVIATLWQRVVIPWYEERVYHDARIEGSWEGGATVGGIKTEDSFFIKRQGHLVTGTIRVSGAREGYYSFQGTFRNLILALTYASVDGSRLNRGSITMKLGGDGMLLDGMCVHYDSDSGEIECQKYRLEKRGPAFSSVGGPKSPNNTSGDLG